MFIIKKKREKYKNWCFVTINQLGVVTARGQMNSNLKFFFTLLLSFISFTNLVFFSFNSEDFLYSGFNETNTSKRNENPLCISFWGRAKTQKKNKKIMFSVPLKIKKLKEKKINGVFKCFVEFSIGPWGVPTNME